MDTDDRNIIQIRKAIRNLPPLPATVTKVLEICNNPDTSPADLNRVISLDPVLVGKLLQLVNSAYYGLPQKVLTLVHAIILLGINTVKNLVLGAAVLGELGGKKNFKALNSEAFWKHSVSVGVIARLLAARNNIPRTLLEEYFVGGLLHDIGKIPLNSQFSEDYRKLLNGDRKEVPFCELEKETFGVDHGFIGQMIAESWKLGPSLTDALEYHHQVPAYEGENGQLVAHIAAADALAQLMESPSDSLPHWVESQIAASREAGILQEEFASLQDTVQMEIVKARGFLQGVK